MTAFPQLVRCFQAQYRGLTDEEREWLAQMSSAWRVDHVTQQVLPIWTVEYHWGPIYVLSVKHDVVGRL